MYHKGYMIKIKKDFALKNNLPSFPGIILRAPYEKQIQLTDKLTACEMMIDILINGQIYQAVPIKFCISV